MILYAKLLLPWYQSHSNQSSELKIRCKNNCLYLRCSHLCASACLRVLVCAPSPLWPNVLSNIQFVSIFQTLKLVIDIGQQVRWSSAIYRKIIIHFKCSKAHSDCNPLVLFKHFPQLVCICEWWKTNVWHSEHCLHTLFVKGANDNLTNAFQVVLNFPIIVI